ncbi:RsmB/NOP family class I SAM-dependent RNA methyltransferase [Terasakiella sp. A23]|uniref:RsmB/NOP family class I SAM-dependent RNA methyltransferase n=1 Tax=Terasakiella sp. FCG-A23 TaxID=3080561 RepID=UPI0029552BDA|nr:RsmB/NOP family class I SAM-dependent RNA methyltransferase [Terasakiella sp. A23]MDV7341553.1 RsmB/NOP family class I SAM-dependent RNA methyltransferase [Terasakiella sp. A23]
MNDSQAKSAYGLGRAARLNLVWEMLNEMGETGRNMDAILSSRFKHLQDSLERRDRRDLENRIRSVLLNYRKLLWWLKKIKLAPTMRTLLLADMILSEKSDIAQLEKLCNGAHNRMDMLRKEEIAGLKRLLGQDMIHEDMSEAVIADCPQWAEQGLKEVFGDHFTEEMRALGNKPTTDFRVNTLHASRDNVRESLSQQGFKTENTPLSPVGLRQIQPGGPLLSETDAFRKGWVEVQDEGSQLVAHLVGAKKSMQVIDFCAGAGGKTLAMAAQMENGGHLVASDVHSKRLQRAKVRLKRAGVVNAERRQLENTFDKWVKKSKGKFDRVLIDAPCSGTGTWRRNPDSKWSKDETDLAELVKLQSEILQSATRLAKSGGRVIYATCSLLPEENERQIEAFLKANDTFKLLKAKDVWAELDLGDYPSRLESYFRLTPLQNNCDGFFACVLEKL